jgi:hypothetical protein
VARPSTFPLVDRILDGRLAEYIATARENGDSFERIARNLHADHGIDVTGETIRKWSEAEPVG